MAAPIVFVDIAGPDSESQAAFYRTVFEWEIGADGSFRVPVVAPERCGPGLVEMDGDRRRIP